jgi:hypothetical protein
LLALQAQGFIAGLGGGLGFFKRQAHAQHV